MQLWLPYSCLCYSWVAMQLWINYSWVAMQLWFATKTTHCCSIIFVSCLVACIFYNKPSKTECLCRCDNYTLCAASYTLM